MNQRTVAYSQDFKVGGHIGDVAQRADAGVVLGRGQRSGPPPHQLGGRGRAVTTTPFQKYPPICMNPVAMPVDGRGTCPLYLPLPVATLLNERDVYTASSVRRQQRRTENSTSRFI